MRAGRGALVIAAVAILTLSACSNSEGVPELMNVGQPGAGPDEFAILPTKPIVIPENLAELPAPTPGGANLTDPTPNADAIVALGGRPGAPRHHPSPHPVRHRTSTTCRQSWRGRR